MEPIPAWGTPDPILSTLLLLAAGVALIYWHIMPRSLRELPKAIAGLTLIASVAVAIILLLRGLLG